MISSETIQSAIPHTLKSIDIPGLGRKTQGKVRDMYLQDETRILITTDRQSGFDHILGHIPFKGAVLNTLAAFWFEKTKDIVPNHLVAVLDPNVMVARNCTPIPVEIVVRGYLSGVTKTSPWFFYQQGKRQIYGLTFPDGMKKNEKLPHPIITPTTHGGGAAGHDEPLSREQIISRGLVEERVYTKVEQAALKLFAYGTELCKKKGLILVDTKYEFGLLDGQVVLMDEIHTPDSSRFWLADRHEERTQAGKEPENFDKEFLRLWYRDRGYTGDGEPPAMTEELIIQTAQRYVGAYERITGETFESFSYPVEERITKNVQGYILNV